MSEEMSKPLDNLSGASVRGDAYDPNSDAWSGAAVRGEAVADAGQQGVLSVGRIVRNAILSNSHPCDDGWLMFLNEAEVDSVAALVESAMPTASSSEYEEVLADHRRLVRELDVALNGEDGAAKQASLSDIVCQVKREGIRSVPVLARAADAPAEPMSKDVEWLMQCADEARTSPELATTLRNNVMAGVKSRAADAPDSQPTDFEDRPLKARVLRNELAIIIGCDDGRTSEQKADAVLRWVEHQGKHVFVSVSSQPTDGGVRNG